MFVAGSRNQKRSAEELQEKISEYETFLDAKLKKDLEEVLEQRDKVYEKISEYVKLRNNIDLIWKSGMESLKSMVNLGCDFYVQAKVPDATYVFVDVGFNFYLQMTPPEAIAFIEKKVTHLTSIGDAHTETAGKIKAHIKIVVEALHELQFGAIGEGEGRSKGGPFKTVL
eukprot:Nk52_evm3s434 gene=Nk52_evmTU3s434